MRELTAQELDRVSGGADATVVVIGKRPNFVPTAAPPTVFAFDPDSIEQTGPEQPSEQDVTDMNWEWFPALDLTLEDGTNLNPDNFVLENWQTRAMFEKFAEALKAEFPDVIIEITGGDRFVASDGKVYSSTNQSEIDNSAPNSKHIFGKAVDFRQTGVSDADIERIARSVGFSWHTDNYDDGHHHLQW